MVALVIALLGMLLASPVHAWASETTVTVIAVGDMLFDLAPRRLIDAQGGAAPLAYVAPTLRRAQVTVGNLETTLSNRGPAVGGKPAHLIFNGHPKGVVSLRSSGFDFVALANNHMMDHGRPALSDTIGTLDRNGIKHAGAGMNSTEAWRPAIIERNGAKIAFLSFTERLPSGFLAGASRPGVASAKDMRRVKAAIRAAKRKADYVIVSFHWGVEQSYWVNSSQISAGRAAVDAGADMVLSHHPHVMQGVEFYKDGLIAYSLGNFLFPYKTVEGRKSFILRAQLTPRGIRNAVAYPVYLGQYGRPSIQTGSSATHILGKLKRTSQARGTRVYIKNNRARLMP